MKKRALIVLAGTMASLGVAMPAASAAPCHPHPEICEAEENSGTDHFPRDVPTHGPGSLGPLQWWYAANGE